MKQLAYIEFLITRASDEPFTQEERDTLISVIDAKAAGEALTAELAAALQGTDAPEGVYTVEVNLRVRTPETAASETPHTGRPSLHIVGGTDTKH